MASSITFKDTNTNKTDSFTLLSNYTVTTPQYDYNGNLAWEKVLNLKQKDNTVVKLPLTKSSYFSESTRTKFKFNNTNYYIATWWFPKEISLSSTYYPIASSYGSGYYYAYNCEIYGPDNVSTYRDKKSHDDTITLYFKASSGSSSNPYPKNQEITKVFGNYSGETYYRILDGPASYNFPHYAVSNDFRYYGDIVVTWIWNGITYRKTNRDYDFGKSAES